MGGQDIAFLDSGNDSVDLAIEAGDLVADDGLETAVLISLFSDRFVPVNELPDNTFERRGWWADSLFEDSGDKIGSKLWLLDRGKIESDTENRAKEYCEEALSWMIEAGLADRIEVDTELIPKERIEISVNIFKPEGDSIPFRFSWDGQEMKRG